MLSQPSLSQPRSIPRMNVGASARVLSQVLVLAARSAFPVHLRDDVPAKIFAAVPHHPRGGDRQTGAGREAGRQTGAGRQADRQAGGRKK